MENESSAPDFQFIQLILSLHGAAMQQMGKVQSPITGKIERDLAMCKNTIDMIEMIDRKTKGNLTDDEKRLVDRVLFECRMNFVDEAKKNQAGDSAPKPEAGDGDGGAPSAEGGA
jgi:hypothetical protein